MIKVTVVCAVLFFLSGCAFYHEKNPGDPTTVKSGQVNWPRIQAEVFQPRCAICHSAGGAGFDMSSYADVVASIQQVQDRAIAKQSMPPDSPLTPYEQALLNSWINDGLPQ